MTSQTCQIWNDLNLKLEQKIIADYLICDWLSILNHCSNENFWFKGKKRTGFCFFCTNRCGKSIIIQGQLPQLQNEGAFETFRILNNVETLYVENFAQN